jgi:hypothetical protein
MYKTDLPFHVPFATSTSFCYPSPRHRCPSDTHVDAVLQQLGWGSWKPLAFLSQKLSSPETCYSTVDHELLAVYLSVHQFRFFPVHITNFLLLPFPKLALLSPQKGNDTFPSFLTFRSGNCTGTAEVSFHSSSPEVGTKSVIAL